jgi:hypothetical protein
MSFPFVLGFTLPPELSIAPMLNWIFSGEPSIHIFEPSKIEPSSADIGHFVASMTANQCRNVAA